MCEALNGLQSGIDSIYERKPNWKASQNMAQRMILPMMMWAQSVLVSLNTQMRIILFRMCCPLSKVTISSWRWFHFQRARQVVQSEDKGNPNRRPCPGDIARRIIKSVTCESATTADFVFVSTWKRKGGHSTLSLGLFPTETFSSNPCLILRGRKYVNNVTNLIAVSS